MTKLTSLKHYLFGITVLFIVLLTLIQIALFNFAETRIQDEIEQRSRTLSDVAMKVVNKQIYRENIQLVSRAETMIQDQGSVNSQSVRILVESRPGYEVSLGDGYTFRTGENTKLLRILPNEQPSNITMHEVPHVALSRIGDSFRVSLTDQPDTLISQHIVQFDQQSSVVERYFNWIIVATLGLMGSLLVYFYWLSGRISSPLQQLGKGFSQLEEGKYGVQIPETGIEEVRYTMQQFNHMSQRLEYLKQQELQWQQQQQLLEIHEVSKGLAHTLRNPLNTIGLAVEHISQEGVSVAERQSLAQSIRQKITRLDTTIKTMLRLNSHDLKRDSQVDIDSVIQDVMLELSSNTGPQIKYQNHSHHLCLKGAESEIRAVIHSIISNALEASHTGQPVVVGVKSISEWIEITVCDNGVGIEGKDIEELFKPHTSDKAEGAGMGLFLARRICRAHYDGNISLEENPPQGCKVTIRLKRNSEDV